MPTSIWDTSLLTCLGLSSASQLSPLPLMIIDSPRSPLALVSRALVSVEELLRVGSAAAFDGIDNNAISIAGTMHVDENIFAFANCEFLPCNSFPCSLCAYMLLTRL